MSLICHRIINNPIDSNCFVVYHAGDRSCIIIDPGSENDATLIAFLEKESLIPKYILLTHEHFDHILGVNTLKEKYDPIVVCSESCAKSIKDPKKNLSVFYNQKEYKVNSVDIILHNKNETFNFNGINIRFYETPGHSEGSIVIEILNHLFVGDLLIRNSKTVTKLPGGNKSSLITSVQLVEQLSKNNSKVIHSGHGEDGLFSDFINYI